MGAQPNWQRALLTQTKLLEKPFLESNRIRNTDGPRRSDTIGRWRAIWLCSDRYQLITRKYVTNIQARGEVLVLS